MNILDITFQENIWIYLLLPILGILGLFFYLGYKKKERSLAQFINSGLRETFTQQVSTPKRNAKKTLLFIGLALVVISMARPQWDYYWEERPEETTDILFALDTSKSMLAPDLKPNRLFRAQLAIEDLVNNLQGVRIGLIPFAGDAFLWCPLTYDKEAFIDSLRGVDTNIIPVGGTNLLTAVETAEKAFTKDKKTAKMMILITDGEDLSDQLSSKLPKIAAAGWTIHAVGIGTEEGELIPITAEDGSTSFVKDADGNVVKTKLDSATLKEIADKTGGSYHPLGPTGEGLQELFDQNISVELEKREETRLRKIPIDRYGWFAAAAAIFLLIELFIKDRKRMKHNSSAAVVALLAGFGLLSSNDLSASVARDAQKAFDGGEFEQAEALYLQAANQKPEKKMLHYNAGVSALNSGELETAKQAFDAALTSDQIALQEQSYFNRGNTNYYLGRQQLDQNPQNTVQLWEESIKDYEAAIALNPENSDAEANRDEVKRLLEKLKELLQQNNDQQNENQDQNQDQQDQSQDQNNDQQNNQDQQNQDQNQQDQNQNDQEQNQDQQSDSENSQDQQQQNEQNQDKQGENQEEQQDQQSPEEQDQEGSPEEQKGEDEKQEGQNQQQPNSTPQPQGAQPEPSEKEKQEAMQLLESLKNEDGDFKELFFKLQNPEEKEETDKDW